MKLGRQSHSTAVRFGTEMPKRWKPPRFTHESAGRIPGMSEELFRIRDNTQNVFYRTLQGQERFTFKNAIHRERILNIILEHKEIQ
jgi:hypothetical protein